MLHILLSDKIHLPVIPPDENSYIGNARQFLFGYGFLPNVHYYYPGYSFAIMPVFLISNDINVTYKLIQLVNAFLMSFVPVLIYYLIPIFNKKDIDKIEQLFIVVAVSLYPSFLTYPSIAMSESLSIPLFLLLTILVHKLANNKNNKFLYAGVPLLASYALLTHPIGVGVMASFVIVASLILIKQRNYLNIALFLTCLIFSLIVVKLALGEMQNLLISHLDGSFFKLERYNVPETLAYYIKERSHIFDLYKPVFGHLLYIIFSTLGLSVFGIVYAFKTLAKKDSRFYVILFSSLTLIFVLIESILYISTTDVGAEKYFYGRYVDSVIAPVFVLGLIYFFKKKLDSDSILTILLLPFILVVILGVDFWIFLNHSHNVFIVMSPGIYFYRQTMANYGYISFLFLYFSIMIVFYILGNFNKKNAITFMSLFFLVSSVCLYFNLLRPHTKFVEKRKPFITSIKKYLAVTNDTNISYDKHGRFDRIYSYIPVFLPKTRYYTFDSSKNEKPKSDFVITGDPKFNKHYAGAILLATDNYAGAMFLAKDEHYKTYLWILPGKKQQYFVKSRGKK